MVEVPYAEGTNKWESSSNRARETNTFRVEPVTTLLTGQHVARLSVVLTDTTNRVLALGGTGAERFGGRRGSLRWQLLGRVV